MVKHSSCDTVPMSLWPHTSVACSSLLCEGGWVWESPRSEDHTNTWHRPWWLEVAARRPPASMNNTGTKMELYSSNQLRNVSRYHTRRPPINNAYVHKVAMTSEKKFTSNSRVWFTEVVVKQEWRDLEDSSDALQVLALCNCSSPCR